MFKTILIANRGEIACRVIKTARRMGIRTVAVYSDADAHALHVQMADEAHHLGPPPAAESYLLADKIIEIAKASGAEAIHPGYGFLSENARFSKACDEAGIAFIGPKPHTIEAMGSKARAKQLMAEAGVPMLPGYQGEEQSTDVFKAEADRIGYPVLLKAAAGGGGKGMRIVQRAEDLEAELESAKREAMSAFGDDRFIVEKFLSAPRHVEVQVFGDSHGSVVHLFERDCSVQRRYQKVVEEAPAPNIHDDTRAALHKAAVDAARKVDYVGAGTVEFLYDGADGVFFMEMNTRLQVEHPVTEEITGLDLVEWQLRVAAGEPLPLQQDDIQAKGHAMEARLYAEDPSQNYLPQVGRLQDFAVGTHLTVQDVALRVDTGVEAGSEITPFYDPMIAKVIVRAETRSEASLSLAEHLSHAVIDGLETNRDQLVQILRHEEFVAAPPSTKFLTDHPLDGIEEPTDTDYILGAFSYLKARGQHGWKAGEVGLGFRLNGPSVGVVTFEGSDKPVSVRIELNGIAGRAQVDDETYHLTVRTTVREQGDGVDQTLSVSLGDETYAIASCFWRGESEIGFYTDDRVRWLTLYDPFASAGAAEAGEAALSSPMPATVTGVKVVAGDRVEAGDVLVTLEAMKMETVIKAPAAGEVTAVHFQQGDSAPKGAKLLDLSTE
ncbi:MAG: biotin carboxylase N-terminal domain-containing protein [Pseudomonadota bacterium]